MAVREGGGERAVWASAPRRGFARRRPVRRARAKPSPPGPLSRTATWVHHRVPSRAGEGEKSAPGPYRRTEEARRPLEGRSPPATKPSFRGARDGARPLYPLSSATEESSPPPHVHRTSGVDPSAPGRRAKRTAVRPPCRRAASRTDPSSASRARKREKTAPVGGRIRALVLRRTFSLSWVCPASRLAALDLPRVLASWKSCTCSSPR